MPSPLFVAKLDGGDGHGEQGAIEGVEAGVVAAGVVGGVDGGVSKAVVLRYGLAARGRVVEGWGKGGDEEAEAALDSGVCARVGGREGGRREREIEQRPLAASTTTRDTTGRSACGVARSPCCVTTALLLP